MFVHVQNSVRRGTNKINEQIYKKYINCQEYILEVRTCGTVRWGYFLQHKNVLAMFLEPDCIGFDIPQNAVEVVLIHT